MDVGNDDETLDKRLVLSGSMRASPNLPQWSSPQLRGVRRLMYPHVDASEAELMRAGKQHADTATFETSTGFFSKVIFERAESSAKFGPIYR